MIKGFHIPFHWKEEEIKKMGSELIETGHYSWVEIKWPVNYVGMDCASYVRGIRWLIEQYPVGVSCHIPTNLDLGQTNVGMRRELIHQIKQCADYAAELRVSILPVHPGTIMTMDIPTVADTEVKRELIAAGERKKNAARQMTIEVVSEIAEYAAQYDMTIALENLLLPQEVAHSAEDLRSLVDGCHRENVRALFDCGHAHRVKAPVGDFVRTLGNRICHVHINDNDTTCDLHAQMGEGSIPYADMFQALREINYKGALVMETDYDSIGDLLRSSSILDQYLND